MIEFISHTFDVRGIFQYVHIYIPPTFWENKAEQKLRVRLMALTNTLTYTHTHTHTHEQVKINQRKRILPGSIRTVTHTLV